MATPKIFSIDGRDLADKIIRAYPHDKASGDTIGPGKVRIDTFSDKEISINFLESVRGLRVFLVCSTNSTENIMKLMLAVDAAKRASAEEVVAIIPYYGYGRQDKKDGIRGCIGARVFADMIQSVGVDRVVTIDLHAEQIQGFFKIPVDHIEGKYVFYEFLRNLNYPQGWNLPKDTSKKHQSTLTLCSPDAGGVKRVSTMMKKINDTNPDATMVMLSKRRDKPNSIESMDLIGDVQGRDVIIVDDMVDTAGTLCKAAERIMEAGASSVQALCTHGILSGLALERIQNSPLQKMIISDTVGKDIDIQLNTKIEVINCAPAIAKIIKAINNKQSANVLEEQS